MIDRERLEAIVGGFQGKRIAVVGDVMLDMFLSGEVRVKSENPVLNMRVDKIRYVPGGAANVATNIAVLNGQAELYGLIGNDPDGERLKGIIPYGTTFHYAHEGETLVKGRCYSKGHPTYGFDLGEAKGTLAPMSLANEELFYNSIAEAAGRGEISAIILSDYNKRVLRGGLAQRLIALGREKHLPVIADFKPANVELFRGCQIIKINESEARKVAGLDESKPIAEAATWCRSLMGGSNVIISLGERGSIVYESSMHSIPTKEVGVSDVTGAGDTVISTLALATASGATLLEAAEIANYAAACVVSKPGTATLTQDELLGMFD